MAALKGLSFHCSLKKTRKRQYQHTTSLKTCKSYIATRRQSQPYVAFLTFAKTPVKAETTPDPSATSPSSSASSSSSSAFTAARLTPPLSRITLGGSTIRGQRKADQLRVSICPCVHVFHVFCVSSVHVLMFACVHAFMCACGHAFMCSSATEKATHLEQIIDSYFVISTFQGMYIPDYVSSSSCWRAGPV